MKPIGLWRSWRSEERRATRRVLDLSISGFRNEISSCSLLQFLGEMAEAGRGKDERSGFEV